MQAIPVRDADLILRLDVLIRLQKRHLAQGRALMAKVDELLKELAEANTTTNEIASDLDDLIAKLGAGGLSPEEATAVQEKIKELSASLKDVAAKH